MKHIKKKFLNQRKITEDIKEAMANHGDIIDRGADLKKVDIRKNQEIHLITDKDYLIKAFKYNSNGQTHYIPEPDPVLINFHSAQSVYKELLSAKKRILSNTFSSDAKASEGNENNIYQFFSFSNIFVISLFTTLESFINNSIPQSYNYKDSSNRKTEIYNWKQVQRYIDFKTKKDKVLKEIFNKPNFADKYSRKHQFINNLKELRDDIVHTKKDDFTNVYGKIYTNVLNFKYEDTLHSVRDFINYYKPCYIEECDCGEDF